MTRILLPLLGEANEIARSVALISIVGSPGTGNTCCYITILTIAPVVMHYACIQSRHVVCVCGFASIMFVCLFSALSLCVYVRACVHV